MNWFAATTSLFLAVVPIEELQVRPAPAFFISSHTLRERLYKTTYSLTTNRSSSSIVAFLETPLPEGVQLFVYLEPPHGAKSLGFVPLSSSPSVVLTEVSQVAEENLMLSYKIVCDDLPSAGSYLQKVRFSFQGSTSSIFQALELNVASITNLTATGVPSTMTVELDPQGFGSSISNNTTYGVVSNTRGVGFLKIIGEISSGGNLPAQTSLKVSLSSKKGESRGLQTLSTTPIDLVQNLPTIVSDTGMITYLFTVSSGWNIAAQTLSRRVKFTLTAQ